MNKIALYGLMALSTVAFASCDGYDEPNPPAQSNAQESILKTDDVTVASIMGEEVFDLAAYNAENKDLEIITLTTTELPDIYELGAEVEISAKGAGNWAPVEATVVRGTDDPSVYTVNVTADDLQGVYYGSISKAPAQNEIDVRVRFTTNLKLNTATQVAYVGGLDNYYGPFTMNIKPFPAQVEIEDAYYFVPCENGQPNFAKAILLSHTGDNPYDSPLFTTSITINEAMASSGYQWIVVPESTYAAGKITDVAYGAWGVANAGEDALEGTLVPTVGNITAQIGTVTYAGQYLFTADILNASYSFNEAIPNFWVIGDGCDWNFANAKQLFTDDYSNYMGFAYLKEWVKFTSEPDWSALYNLGAGDTDGKLANGSNNNCSVPAPGLYWINMNLPELSYKLNHVTTLGLIGDACPNGWDASVALTPSDDFLTWTGTVTMGDGTFKIRANDAWDINFGGEANNLVFNAANIPSPGAGAYNVTLNLNQLPYTITFVKK
ncbi:MAG: SusF/SusE family outer membrane protein [Bacteroidales bacterium]|nr:SusF/SusE family outer membrane protein [Bacteroidales bacterium]